MNEKKYEGFGGRPPVGGRPGTRAPGSPLNPALDITSIIAWQDGNLLRFTL